MSAKSLTQLKSHGSVEILVDTRYFEVTNLIIVNFYADRGVQREPTPALVVDAQTGHGAASYRVEYNAPRPMPSHGGGARVQPDEPTGSLTHLTVVFSSHWTPCRRSPMR